MLVCRCCLTFEDNLYPFTEYKISFRDCTGISVESTALICPTCIRKLNEAYAFREQSLRSDDFLKNQKTEADLGVIIKSEPVDDEDEVKADIGIYDGNADFDDDDDDDDDENDRFDEPQIKLEEIQDTKIIATQCDESQEFPLADVMLLETLPDIERSQKRKKKNSRSLITPESVANSIRAKLAWSHGAKENLIKECPYCFLSGLKKIDLKHHIQQHVDANGGFSCDHCNKKFMKKKVLKGHLLRVYLGIRRSGPATLVCTACQEVFTKVESFREHYAEKHPELPVPKPTSVGPFVCTECNKELSSKHCLQMHELTHTGLRPWQCVSCGHNFRTKDQLKNHELTHTEGPLPWLCTACGKSFKSKSQMSAHISYKHSDNAHVRRHPKTEQIFSCDFCSKQFKAKNLLKSHLISHDDAMNYSCDICGMKFKRASNWRLHKSTHSEQRDFRCGECLTQFKRRYALKRHMGQHAYKMGLVESSFELRKGTPNSGIKIEGFIMQGPPRYTNPPVITSPEPSNLISMHSVSFPF